MQQNCTTQFVDCATLIAWFDIRFVPIIPIFNFPGLREYEQNNSIELLVKGVVFTLA